MAVTLNANHAMVRSSGSNPTINLGTTPTVDSCIVVGVAVFGTTVTAVSDNQASGGNTYTQRQSRFQGSPGDYGYTARAHASSGTFTITVTSGGGDHQIVAANFDGTDTTADPYNVGGNNFATGTSPTVTSSASSTVTPCAIVVILTNGGNTTCTPSDTQIEEQEDGNSGMPINVQWRRDTGATGTKTSTWTIGTSLDWMALVLVLKEDTSGGGAQDTPELRGRPAGLRGQLQMHQLLAQ